MPPALEAKRRVIAKARSVTAIGLAAFLALAGAGCGGEVYDAWTGYQPDPDDEIFDPTDPPGDPDPDDAYEDTVRESYSNGTAQCPPRPKKLSPKGLTFVLHITKHDTAVAVGQLKQVRHLIRARDIFMIERNDPALNALRAAFPCNAIHHIAYPAEIPNGLALGFVDGVAVDWEKKTFSHSQAWTISRLLLHSKKIRAHGKRPSVVPYWPGSFNDGHILKASKMDYELAQIQNRCVVGPAAFAAAAKALLNNFAANGVGPRRIGFEISLNSYAFAQNHTGVKRSAWCARKAYGKGARAIYLYGNGQPHYVKFFKRMRAFGLRKPQ